MGKRTYNDSGSTKVTTERRRRTAVVIDKSTKAKSRDVSRIGNSQSSLTPRTPSDSTPVVTSAPAVVGLKRKIRNGGVVEVKTECLSHSDRKHVKLEAGGDGGDVKKSGGEPEWRWWEEEKPEDGRKWTTLTHMGPVFAPEYERLPASVKFRYDGQVVCLSIPAEEVMTFYAKMLTNPYTSKATFNENFMRDWRSFMTESERDLIVDLSKCDFGEVHRYFAMKSEERKALTKEQKQAVKAQNEAIRQRYGFCLWDGHRQPVGNYKIEPPGLFRGRGEHPKQGRVKMRIQPEDVTINYDGKFKCPEPPEGHRWKDVRHDNKVSWLATWTENVTGNNKYVMLNASARVKAERDWQKYEKARKLHRVIDKIRAQYMEEWKSKEMRIRQRAVALYFIDRLALRVGNEKEDDEADTVGCCSLRYEHIRLHPNHRDHGDYVVEFDFLGKDSIRYHNFVAVERSVYKSLEIFLKNKEAGDDLFDRVTTISLNQYLTELMDGLTAKVFRTYNASCTLQDNLDSLTGAEDSIHVKLSTYNEANRRVAILCNHQRTVPKTFDKSMQTLNDKIAQKEKALAELETASQEAKSEYNAEHSIKAKQIMDRAIKRLDKGKEQLEKLKSQAKDRFNNKDIALGTSKLNYLDPRISVAWCKKYGVPIEKIFSKTHREKFNWAIHMADENFHFYKYEGEIKLRQPISAGPDERGDGEEDDEEESS